MKKLTHKILSGADDVYLSKTGRSVVVVRVYTLRGKMYSNSNYYPATAYNKQVATKYAGRLEHRR